MNAKVLLQRRRMMITCGWFVFLFWLLVGPWPRSWAEWEGFQSPVFVEARPSTKQERLLSSGPLRVGVGRVNLTEQLATTLDPKELARIPLAGYGKRVVTQGNDGVADPLWIKALVLDNGREKILVLTADLLLINRVLAARVMRLLPERGIDLPRCKVLFTASHTHSGYAGYPGKLFESLSLGLHREAVADGIAHALADAAAQAWKQRVPARMQSHALELPSDTVSNRTIHGGPTNDWLDLIQFLCPDDSQPIATLVMSAAHATCRPCKDHLVSADYPGVFSRTLEETLGGTCLFAAGAVGGMGPAEMGISRDLWSDRLGVKLASHVEIERSEWESSPTQVVLGAVGRDLRVPAPQIKLPGDWRLSPIASGILAPSRAYLQAVRIGDRLILATPADFSGEIAEEIRDQFPGITTLVASFNGDYVGYVLPDKRYELPSYEPRSMVLLGPNAGTFFRDSLLALARPLSLEQASTFKR